MTGRGPVLSITVPVFNEEEVLRDFYQQLKPVLVDLGLSHEIILVDDGSTDRSYDVIRELHAEDPCVAGIRLSRNFGHQAALSAAYQHARGDAVVCLDADLQHPPALIPRFVEKWRDGYDIVIGVKKSETSSLYRRLATGLAYRLIRAISHVDIPAHAPDFRLLDRKALTALLSLPERERLLRGLIAWIGFKRTEIEFEVAPRLKGRSSYSFAKLAALAIDGALSFSIVPLRVSTILGFVVSLAGFAYLLFVVGARLFTSHVPEGWASVLASLLLVGGCQMIILGIIGEYIGRMYQELKQRPLYIIQDLVVPRSRHDPPDR